MRLRDVLHLSFLQMLRGRGQSRLTVLSVAIGIFSVVLIASCGAYAARAVSTELHGLGIDGLLVYLKDPARPGLDETLGDSLVREVDGVETAVPINVSVGACSIHGTTEGAAVIGVGEGIGDALHLELLYGRLPDAADVERAAHVAAIDETLALQFYKRVNIIGKTVTVRGQNAEETFEICGIIRARSAGLALLTGGSLPHVVYVPYTAAPEYDGLIRQVAVRCSGGESPDAAADRIRSYLDTRHARDGSYAVENISGYIERVERITQVITVFLTLIGGIGLLIAGFSVMSSMLGAQALRRREIGIYLSLGALRRDILRCYLCESVLLCGIGGVIGTAACCAVFLGIRLLGVRIPIQLGMLAAALGMTAACGLLFGFIPACRAAALEPMDALRED